MRFQWMTFILVLWPSATLQRSDVNSPRYTAAIVEYTPVFWSPNTTNLGTFNAKNFLKIIKKAATYGIDIIVFPEGTLSVSSSGNDTIKRSEGASYIPDSKDEIVPCNDTTKPYEYSITSISCAAKTHQIYVLINHQEKVDCTRGTKGCPNDGYLIYNTNVVFDRKGQVIARYRKYNLFDEHGINVTEPIPTTFKTDFGVTFGTFTCFDLLAQRPALNLTRNLNVTDILFSTEWYSQLPYLYAIEVQGAWAYANDVNFLAASHNHPSNGSGGSGIFLGKQGHVKVISENRRANIIAVAKIPKVINGKRKLNINQNEVITYEFTKKEIDTSELFSTNKKWIYRRSNLSAYSSKLIDLKQKSHNITVCDKGFCCDFKLKVELNETKVKNNSNYYYYRLAVLNRFRVHNEWDSSKTTTCGVIACINNTLEGCGDIFQNGKTTVQPTTFVSLEITTHKVSNENTFLMPVTFSQSMIPLNVTDFSYEFHSSSDRFSVHHMKLTKPVNNLLTFAIYGRDFSKNAGKGTRGSSCSFLISPVLLLTAVVTYVLL